MRKPVALRSVRKTLAALTPADLDLCPVWELAREQRGGEGRGEATVKPHEYRGEPDPTAARLIVRARFRLADRTFADGCLMAAPPDDADLSRTQPAIFTPQGQVGFWWNGLEPAADEAAAEHYRRLGKSGPGEVFPIHFLSVVPLRTGAVSGEIPGFIVVADSRGTLRIVR